MTSHAISARQFLLCAILYAMQDSLQNIGLKQIRKLVPIQNGLMLDDDFYILDVKYSDNLKFLMYPCRTDAFIAVFCKTGHFDIEINLKTYHIEDNMYFLGTPGNIVKFNKPMENELDSLDFIVMAISKEFLSSISFDFKKLFGDRMNILSEPCVRLTDRDLEFSSKYLDLFAGVMKSDIPNKREAVGSLLGSLLYVMSGLMKKDADRNRELQPETANTRVKLVFDHFMSLVTEYHSVERNMAFYASRLGLTPKYLSKLIKQVSGRSAPDWIDSFVILEAKNMLKYTDDSIKEIVYKLHFPNPSVFYKFFKAHTGMTPSEYRNG